MISYKVLIILTVIFDIIFCNKQVEECIEISNKVGFILSDTGFYNYNFVRQFADFTDFLKYVETKINISSYDNVTLPKEIGHGDATMDTQDDSTPINRKRKNTDNVTLPEKIRFLQTFYFIIRNSNIHALFVNPYQFCSVGVKKNVPVRKFQHVRDRFIALILKKSVPVDETDIILQRLEGSIRACEERILGYELKIENKTFKYHQYNVHKNFLTSYEMALLKDPKKDTIGSLSLNFGSETIGSKEMDFGKMFIGGYFKYHISLFGDIFNAMEKLTTPALCKSYFLNNNEDE